MQEARARGGEVLNYPSGASANGFTTQEEWSHVLSSGGTQAGEGSRAAHESRLALPGDGAYLPKASQRNDAEDATDAASITKSR